MTQTTGINLGDLIKQAQAIQQSFEANKEKIKQQTASATVGGNMVTAIVDGEKNLKWIKISPDLLKEDVSTIEDLVVSAVNAANAEIDKKINSSMASFVGNALGGNLGGALNGANIGDMANLLNNLLGGGANKK